MSQKKSAAAGGGLPHRVAAAFAGLLVRRPGAIALLTLVLAVGGATSAALWLRVNPNQLDLISQDLRQVKDVKRIVDMVGGSGHIIIALRGNDEENLKKAADDVAAILLADKENIRTVTYRISTDFVRERAALFMETEDLVELRRRVMEKLRDAAKRASPFFFEITPTEPVELKVDDIIEKYTRIGKKSIIDDYYISDDRKMLILTVKPMWATTDILETGRLRESLRERFAGYSKTNGHGITLLEDYEGVPDQNGEVVHFGFTGSYINSHDDEVQIIESLLPVTSLAAAGVVLVLLAFFRRRVGSVFFVVSGLGCGVAVAMGFALLSVGELNMITSILAGILMGTGIDFGIFLVYRLREELGRHDDLSEAIRSAVTQAGPASFVSAAGTGIAFLSLMLSEFRGFSQFGLLAGAGVFLIALTIYSWVPTTLLLLERRFPGLPRRLLGTHASGATEGEASGRIPRPGLILAAAAVVTIPVAFFAPRVVFDYDSRALIAEEQQSIRLGDEINERMQIASDPVAVYSRNFEEAKAVWDHFLPLDPVRHSTIDQVVSIYSFLPPADQQERNAAILAEWKAELQEIDRELMPEEIAERWGEAMEYLDARPYGIDEIPPLYADLFKHLPQTKPENHGVLTFIYPKVDMWDGKNLLKFTDEVEVIETAQGTFTSAGSSVLMATLARIVLKDSRMFVAVTLALLLVVLLVDTRSLRSTAVALLPLTLGVGLMLGVMALLDQHLNFMNIVVFPIVLGYAVSQGVYFIHRFHEGTSARAALRSVGTAVACSTFTTLMGWAALMAAAHKGLKTMGVLACLGMVATLVVSFSVMPAVLQILDDRRRRREPLESPASAPAEAEVKEKKVA